MRQLTVDRPAYPVLQSWLMSPWAWIGLFLLLVIVGLSVPLRVPLGANYWDTSIYLDAAQRIRVGQVPSLDFATPVGPLGYYLPAIGINLFPGTPTILTVQWCIAVVTLPLLGVLVAHVAQRSRQDALALTLPFLLFSLFPMNLHDLYPLPGFDGYGYYNRHTSLLLYLLVAVLLFVTSRNLMIALTTALMLAFFFTKITGAVAGILLIGAAIICGRVLLRDMLIAAGIVIAVIGCVEVLTGIVSAYIETILVLVRVNDSTLLRRILTVASVKFNVVGTSLLLLATLVFLALSRGGSLRGLLANMRRSSIGMFAATLFALAAFETQNTGSLEFFGLWPVLLLILREMDFRTDRIRLVVIVMVAAVTLPTLVTFVERVARAVLSAPSYHALKLDDLRGLGRVLAKPDVVKHAETMLDHYVAYKPAYAELATKGVLPSYILFSELDFQVSWLLSVQEGVTALKAYEAKNNVRFNSLYTFDFTDPFNWLLDRVPPRHVQIGHDPGRTTQAPDERMYTALKSVDAILVPLCPLVTSRNAIFDTFDTALEGRTMVQLSRCWQMWLKK